MEADRPQSRTQSLHISSRLPHDHFTRCHINSKNWHLRCTRRPENEKAKAKATLMIRRPAQGVREAREWRRDSGIFTNTHLMQRALTKNITDLIENTPLPALLPVSAWHGSIGLVTHTHNHTPQNKTVRSHPKRNFLGQVSHHARRVRVRAGLERLGTICLWVPAAPVCLRPVLCVHPMM